MLCLVIFNMVSVKKKIGCALPVPWACGGGEPQKVVDARGGKVESGSFLHRAAHEVDDGAERLLGVARAAALVPDLHLLCGQS